MFETFGTILKVKHFFRDGVAITNKGDKYFHIRSSFGDVSVYLKSILLLLSHIRKGKMYTRKAKAQVSLPIC